MPTIRNKTFDQIAVGDSASLAWTATREDAETFAVLSRDFNPIHLDEDAAQRGVSRALFAPEMLGASLFSSLLATQLPGPGTVHKTQSCAFHRPVALGDELSVSVTATKKIEADKRILFSCRAVNQRGETVIEGDAEARAPTETIAIETPDVPEMKIRRRHHVFERIIEDVRGTPPVKTSVCHPCDEVSLGGAVEAAKAGLIVPVLVGPQAKIREIARTFDYDLSQMEIRDAEHSHAAAQISVALCRAGECEALMKGSLHTDEMMREVANSKTGLRTGRRISHVYVLDAPSYHKPLYITDAAINIYPSLEDKVDIIQNCIDLVRVMGVAKPLVAILSAVETVYPKIASTVEAAALCKMADRGQIRGALLDGPLAFDNAISKEAARIKKIDSPVAGDADILLAPDLEAGNMLAKQLCYLAEADMAGVVLGARTPIIVTSRADSAKARLASCAVSALYAQARRAGRAKLMTGQGEY